MKHFILSSRSAVVVLAMTCVVDLARSAEPSTAEEATIRTTAAAYLDVLNRGDYDSARTFWTENGNIIDETGHQTNVRDIQPPADGGVKNTNAPPLTDVRTSSIRFVTPDVAIEDGTSENPSRPNGASTSGRFSVVWVKQNGKWLIDSLRESAIANQSSASRIQDLAWIIGDWAEEGGDAAFQASFSWSPGNHFIVGEVRIEPRDQQSHVVTQRIAWDAAAGTIRSWNFDSDGGFSSGAWARDGDAWVVSTNGVLPDGKRTLGRRVFQRIDENSVLMESLGFQIDGQSVPDLRVKLVRSAAKK